MALTDLDTQQYAVESTTTDAIGTDFPFIDDDDVVVDILHKSNLPTTLVKDTDYSVTITNPLAGGYTTGTVTLIASGNHTTGDALRIYRRTALTQSTDFQEYGTRPSAAVENAFDRLTMIAQEEARDSAILTIPLEIVPAATALTTGTAKISWICPYTTFTVHEFFILLGTAATGTDLVTIDINEDGTSFFGTAITINASEITSRTASTPYTIDSGSHAETPVITLGQEISVDIDQVGDTTTGNGATLYLIGLSA